MIVSLKTILLVSAVITLFYWNKQKPRLVHRKDSAENSFLRKKSKGQNIPYIKQDFSPFLKKTWQRQKKTFLSIEDENSFCLKPASSKTSPSVAFYIKIGKTGSTTLYSLMAKLKESNRLTLQILEPENKLDSTSDQLKHYVQTVVPKGPCPKIIIAHWRYINFITMKFANPIYFSLVRKPLDRLESWFYYMKRIGTATENIMNFTFEECLKAGESICPLPKCVMTEYLCGHDEVCQKACNFGDDAEIVRAAAKNVDENVLVVGSLAHFNISLQVLEWMMPNYFTGILKTLEKDIAIRNSNPHPKIARTKDNEILFCNRFAAECDLYEFLIQRLLKQYNQLS